MLYSTTHSKPTSRDSEFRAAYLPGCRKQLKVTRVEPTLPCQAPTQLFYLWGDIMSKCGCIVHSKILRLDGSAVYS